MTKLPSTQFDQLLLKSSLQFSVLKIALRISWIGSLVYLFVMVFVPDRSMVDLSTSLVLAVFFLSLQFVIFKRVRTTNQMDVFSVFMLSGCWSIALMSILNNGQDQAVATLTILTAGGSLLINRNVTFWGWYVIAASALVGGSMYTGTSISMLGWLFIAFFNPWMAIIFRITAHSSYDALISQIREREALIENLKSSTLNLEKQTAESQVARTLLQNNETQLTAILDQSPLVLIVLDEDGNCLQCRGFGLNKLCLDQNETSGPRFDGVFGSNPKINQSINTARKGQATQVHVELGQGVQYEMRFEPVLDSERETTAIVGVGVDVSQRFADEKQRKEMERRLFHSEKLESLGLLAGGVAHDFNNYLAAIVSFTESLLASGNESSKKTLERIRSTAIQAAGVTEEMLLYSGQNDSVGLKIELLDLARFLDKMQPFLKAVLPKSVELRFSTDPSAMLIEGDRTALQRLILNVVKNAAEATTGRDQPQISISISNQVVRKNQHPRFLFGEINGDEGHIQVEICDN